MGWQESRAVLIPEKSTFRFEKPFASRNIPRVIKFDHDDGNHHSIESVRSWLASKGFELSSETAKNATIVELDDIQLKLYSERDKLSEITTTFSLSQNSPMRWKFWKDLIVQLCHKFDLVIFDMEELVKTKPNRLVNVLERTKSWRSFKVEFDWPDYGPS